MTSRPRVSVIIPAYRADATLPRLLAALRPQMDDRTEVVVVDSTGLDHAHRLQGEYSWLRVIGLPERCLPGKARNLGARRAQGSIMAFIDADALPSERWLQRLGDAHEQSEPWAVAGIVLNGTPRSPVGTASYLLEFSEIMPGRRGDPLHAASCNLLVDRAAFEAAGGFAEDLWPGEDTVLTVPWSRPGRLRFAPEAAVWHLNRTGFRELIAHQYRLGRSFASVCDRVELPYAAFSRWPLLALAPLLRLLALGSRLRHQPVQLLGAILVSPLLALGLLAWTAGVASARRTERADRA